MTNIHHTTHFSTKRRELRHEDFWNTRHTAQRRLFQSVHLERCVTNIHPYSLFLHEATGASSRRLLKHTAHSAAPLFQNVHLERCVTNIHHTTHFFTKRRELRHEEFWNSRHTAPRRLFQNVHVERCVATIYQCSLSLPRSAGSIVPSTFETYGE